MSRLVMTAAALALAFASGAYSTTITFDARGAGAPSGFNGHTESPVIGPATFLGGQLLNNESAGTDLTPVYATWNFGKGAYTDPLLIDFSHGVSGFSLQLTNEQPGVYTVADSLGGSETFSVPYDTTQTFTLSDSNIKWVTVTAVDKASWDFAIDNVSFTSNPDLTSDSAGAATPEPSMFLPLTSILLLAGFFWWRSSAKRRLTV